MTPERSTYNQEHRPQAVAGWRAALLVAAMVAFALAILEVT